VPLGRGEDIAEPIVIANLRVLIVGGVIARLGGEFAGVDTEFRGILGAMKAASAETNMPPPPTGTGAACRLSMKW